MPFVVIEIETDTDAIVEETLALIRETFPNYVPSGLDLLIIQANAQEVALQRFALQEVSEEAPAGIADILGVPQETPTQAVGSTTWTFSTDTGHEIPEGTDLALTAADGSPIAFSTTETVTVDIGDTTATVAIEAIEEGSAGSGLSGSVELLSDIPDVDSIVVDDVTSGGADGETTDEFLNRWSDRMQLISDRLIHADDFALYFRTAVSVCARAVALDGYNPGDDSYGNEGMVTVCGIDEDGQPLSGGIKTAAQTEMEENTVSGLTIHMIDPTYTPVDVEVEVVALPGYDTADLEDRVAAAIADYLDPANWGADPTGFDPAAWINERTARYLEAAEAINRVQGVHYIVEPTLELDAAYNTDVALAGAVALTEAGTITVTVHEHGYGEGS